MKEPAYASKSSSEWEAHALRGQGSTFQICGALSAPKGPAGGGEPLTLYFIPVLLVCTTSAFVCLFLCHRLPSPNS